MCNTISLHSSRERLPLQGTRRPSAPSVSLLDLLDSSLEDDVLDLDYGEDDIVSDFLVLEEDDDVNILTGPASAAQPVALAASLSESGTPAIPASTLVIMDVCKRAAARLVHFHRSERWLFPHTNLFPTSNLPFRGSFTNIACFPLSPTVFVRCSEAAVAPLQRQGIRLATYLDNWLLLARSQQEADTHTHTSCSGTCRV